MILLLVVYDMRGMALQWLTILNRLSRSHTCTSITRVGKVWPAGQMRPTSSIDPADGGSSVFAPKDERLPSHIAGFSRTLIGFLTHVNADWLPYT